jgi:hypothetical protein
MGPRFFQQLATRAQREDATARMAGRVTNRGEAERMDLYSEGGNVLLLEFASQVALDEGGLCQQQILAWA